MQDLSIALVQAKQVWEDIEANLDCFKQQIDQIAPGTHLIVLPEMFTTGFSMHPQALAQTMDGPCVAWLKARARDTGADITGSMIIEDAGCYYNRLIWAKPDGTLVWYDKRHLFRYAGEQNVYSAGRQHLLVECQGWRVRPFICYDLRFPIWTRNLDLVYDAAIFVANWPRRRAPHWKALLSARAIENQCYIAGVNRVGEDGNGYRHSGDSRIIDPLGRMIAGLSDEEGIISGRFSANVLQEYRNQFPAWMDADTELLSTKRRG
jgi:predicted amidohydrolase